MTHRLIRMCAWLCLCGIVFVTVSPIHLRPPDLLPVNVDRALAFALLSGLFVLAYPRYWLWVAVLTIASAGGLELLQELSPTRHARVQDAAVKAAGAALGCFVAWAVIRIQQRRNTA